MFHDFDQLFALSATGSVLPNLAPELEEIYLQQHGADLRKVVSPRCLYYNHGWCQEKVGQTSSSGADGTSLRPSSTLGCS